MMVESPTEELLRLLDTATPLPLHIAVQLTPDMLKEIWRLESLEKLVHLLALTRPADVAQKMLDVAMRAAVGSKASKREMRIARAMAAQRYMDVRDQDPTLRPMLESDILKDMPSIIYEPLATAFRAPPRNGPLVFAWAAATTVRVTDGVWWEWLRAESPPTLDEIVAASMRDSR